MVSTQLINSDCVVAMKEMADNSVDSIVTDPPYGLEFMGKTVSYTHLTLPTTPYV